MSESAEEIIFLSIFIFLVLFSSFDSFSQISDKTVINGSVVDAKTGFPITGVSVFLQKTTVGTITDKNGNYSIITKVPADKIVFSFIGYKTESKDFTKNIVQTININLDLSSFTLDEVIVKPSKRDYKNKNNPAVELIDKVIENKAVNRSEKYSYLEYKKYEKIQFALSNITDKVKQGNMFRKFAFVFENIDTTRRITNNTLPIFIKESLSDHYYRKDPEATKEIVIAEKTINIDEYLDNKGVTANLDYLYQNINIYDNDILFLTNSFKSPVANSAPIFYRYYIIDTLSVDKIKCVRLFFEPRSKADCLFHGYLYITLDSSYAIRKIDMGMNKNINIDWVRDVNITQDFDKFGQEGWLLSKDEISIDFSIAKKMMGLYGQRTITYRDYKIDNPVDDKLFAGPQTIERPDPASANEGFWESNRYDQLTKSESGMYNTIDSIRKIPSFKLRMNLLTLFTTGYFDLGNIEIGPSESFLSYNPVEGTRIRFGGRTTTGFSKKITFDSYAAYGLKDNIAKYAASIIYSLTPNTIYQFPVKSLKLSYQCDTRIPGQELQFTQSDNIFLSFQRGVNDKLFLNKTFKAEYFNEFKNNFSYLLGFSYTLQSPRGELFFNTSDYSFMSNDVNNINISELYLNLRYAPNQTFYQGKVYRFPFANKYPVIQLKISGGSKSINNSYDYLRFQLGISRRYYLSILGYTDVSFEAGKIIGKVAYPLLFIHNANQTYSYQKNSYNLMNFLEFVSDKYVSINIDQCFNGFFLNKVPLIKKLKWREIISCKVLYGGLSKKNNPDYQNDLFKFPASNDGIPLTYTLEKQPYIEAGIGVSNILKIFRVDLIKRFTYMEHPNVSGLGFRVQFRFDI
jgi:hypothetical protein